MQGCFVMPNILCNKKQFKVVAPISRIKTTEKYRVHCALLTYTITWVDRLTQLHRAKGYQMVHNAKPKPCQYISVLIISNSGQTTLTSLLQRKLHIHGDCFHHFQAHSKIRPMPSKSRFNQILC